MDLSRLLNWTHLILWGFLHLMQACPKSGQSRPNAAPVFTFPRAAGSFHKINNMRPPSTFIKNCIVCSLWLAKWKFHIHHEEALYQMRRAIYDKLWSVWKLDKLTGIWGKIFRSKRRNKRYVKNTIGLNGWPLHISTTPNLALLEKVWIPLIQCQLQLASMKPLISVIWTTCCFCYKKVHLEPVATD